ncbi:Bifunctional arginine demethylase and lysyl-hydroxylase psr-1 [Diplonema papillatum]|nr:Bifunctional arginine demethylase and lysyl-hydroxylase psr-1 [Diplonema papillatum]
MTARLRLAVASLAFACTAADVSRRDIDLQRAVYEGRTSDVKALVEAGASQVLEKQSCLMLAAHRGDAAAAEALLSRPDRSDPKVSMEGGLPGKEKGTALIFALLGFEERTRSLRPAAPRTDYVSTVRLLISRGAGLSGTDIRGRTPLMIACSTRNQTLIDLLVSLPSAGDHLLFAPAGGPFAGKTPLALLADEAKAYAHVCTLLLQRANRQDTPQDPQGAGGAAAAFDDMGLPESRAPLLRPRGGWWLGDARTCSPAVHGLLRGAAAESLRAMLRALEAAHGPAAAAAVAEEVGRLAAGDARDVLRGFGFGKSAAAAQDAATGRGVDVAKAAAALITEEVERLAAGDARDVLQGLGGSEAAAAQDACGATARRSDVVNAAASITEQAGRLAAGDAREVLQGPGFGGSEAAAAQDACEATGRRVDVVNAAASITEEAGRLAAGDSREVLQGPQDAHEATGRRVDVVEAAELTPERFKAEFFAERRPVLIKHGAAGWPCTAWTTESLAAGPFRDARVTVADVPYASQYGLPSETLPLADFIKGHVRTGSSRYAFDNTLHRTKPEALFSSFAKSPLLAGLRFNPPQVSFGGRGTGSPPHLHQDAVNGVCFGQKVWMMWPPEAAFLSVVPAREVFARPSWLPQPMTVTQEAGDLLYVPSGWGHAVLNTKDTWGIALEYYR